jgi:hypothetical protein
MLLRVDAIKAQMAGVAGEFGALQHRVQRYDGYACRLMTAGGKDEGQGQKHAPAFPSGLKAADKGE